MGQSGLTVSPPNLQGQQPVVVGDFVLSGREEAGIDLYVIFVPVETQGSVADSMVLSRKHLEPLSLLGTSVVLICEMGVRIALT